MRPSRWWRPAEAHDSLRFDRHLHSAGQATWRRPTSTARTTGFFASLEIPKGEGLSGWVAENGKPIINGNPSVEAGYLNDANKYSSLRSALVVPLKACKAWWESWRCINGERDGFTKDHLRVLLAISSKMSLAIENALKYRQAESSATTDYLTNLPNARSLFLRLDSELARCKREGSSLAVLVGDLDGSNNSTTASAIWSATGCCAPSPRR